MSKESRFELREDFRELTIIDGETYLEYEQKSLNDFNDLYYLLNDLSNQKSDLEVKLAEKERLLEDSIDVHETEEKDIYKLRYELAGATETIEVLRKQLADTEEQNKRVLEKLELIVSANQELEQKLAESKNSLKRTIEHYEKYCSEINHQNVMLYASACNAQQASRDKILFTIEQLEKVKWWCENHKYSDEYDYVITYEPDEEDASGCVDYLKDYIDNQIKQLKEGK